MESLEGVRMENNLVKSPEPARVMDIPIHLSEDYPGWLLHLLREKRGAHVVTLNAEMTMQARENPALAQIIRQADLVIPDGSGVVLYLQWQGYQIQRFPGIELAETLLCRMGEFSSLEGDSRGAFFYGGEPGVAQDAAQMWQQQCPDLKIAGVQHGYLSEAEEQDLLATVKEKQPHLIYVGLGVPRQELWIAQHRSLCPGSIWIGVGGSFDIWAGRKDRAPAWLRDRHLEWVYRLYQEPSRWRRMLALPRFAWLSLTQSF
ncbi:WecB/TagA/CpsF family glycosyltransferase [Roseofilum capinflatum]|nr:WecB/TagA/CpsF family glycosyltransferase [Roseofilum capinflatum]